MNISDPTPTNAEMLEGWTRNYTGNFDFMVAMKNRVAAGLPLSPGMLSGIAKCKAAEDRKAAESKPDPNGLNLSGLPTGTTRHAVVNSEGTVTFLRVDNVNKNGSSWKGWVFVKRIVGQREDKIGRQPPGGTYHGQCVGLLAQVLHAPERSMARYGQMVGECGRCGRRLTDDISRRDGIGPECRKKRAH